MNETEIRALGFEPWYGGDEAPGDWDGGNTILRDGKEGGGFRWTNEGGWFDIIGYKKKETPMEYPEWVYARANTLNQSYPALCQMILDHEQPPVDPDVALAEKHADMYADDAHTCVFDAILAAIKEARNA